jgi:hypothetical protein
MATVIKYWIKLDPKTGKPILGSLIQQPTAPKIGTWVEYTP